MRRTSRLAERRHLQHAQFVEPATDNLQADQHAILRVAAVDGGGGLLRMVEQRGEVLVLHQVVRAAVERLGRERQHGRHRRQHIVVRLRGRHGGRAQQLDARECAKGVFGRERAGVACHDMQVVGSQPGALRRHGRQVQATAHGEVVHHARMHLRRDPVGQRLDEGASLLEPSGRREHRLFHFRIDLPAVRRLGPQADA